MRVMVYCRAMWILIFLFCWVAFLCAKIEVLFSPEDEICKKLVEKISETKKRIYVAVYMFTDKRLADALIEAKQQRGTDVQVVTDKKSVEYKYGKVEMLKEHGIDVFVFNPKYKGNKKFRHKMHHKFALLDNCLCTGSYNWTKQADTKNSENLNFFDNLDMCRAYEKEFDVLKKRCKHTKVIKKKGEPSIGLKQKVVDILKRVRDRFG